MKAKPLPANSEADEEQRSSMQPVGEVAEP